MGKHARRAAVLVTGASGYIGGRLVEALERRGRRVRCVTRRPELVAGRFGPGTEVVAGDAADAAAMRRALAGVDAAYYLVHAGSWRSTRASRGCAGCSCRCRC